MGEDGVTLTNLTLNSIFVIAFGADKDSLISSGTDKYVNQSKMKIEYLDRKTVVSWN